MGLREGHYTWQASAWASWKPNTKRVFVCKYYTLNYQALKNTLHVRHRGWSLPWRWMTLPLKNNSVKWCWLHFQAEVVTVLLLLLSLFVGVFFFSSSLVRSGSFIPFKSRSKLSPTDYSYCCLPSLRSKLWSFLGFRVTATPVSCMM